MEVQRTPSFGGPTAGRRQAYLVFFRRRADEIADLTPDYNGLSGEALRRIEGNAETGNLADPENPLFILEYILLVCAVLWF